MQIDKKKYRIYAEYAYAKQIGNAYAKKRMHMWNIHMCDWKRPHMRLKNGRKCD